MEEGIYKPDFIIESNRFVGSGGGDLKSWFYSYFRLTT